jgi:EpsI family protein
MPKKSFWITLILLIATGGVLLKLHVGADIEVYRKNLDKLPSMINGMQSIDIMLEESVVKELDPDVYVFRNYILKDGSIINLYIGYYGTQKGGRSTHNPDACYPGAGWAILSEGHSTVRVANGDKWSDIVLNTMQVSKIDKQQLVYHWYQTDKSEVVVNGIQQNLHRFKSRLLRNRDDGAFIRVSIDYHGNYQDKKREIEGFIQKLFPLIIQYWPQEREKER